MRLTNFLLVIAVLLPAVASAQPVAQSDYVWKAPAAAAPGENIHIPSIMATWCDDTVLIASTPPLAQACTPRVTSKYFPTPVQIIIPAGTAPPFVADSHTAVPGSGTDASNATPAALTLLQTLTVTNPGAYRVQNQSVATVQMQLCPASTVAPSVAGCTTYLLANGAGANAQGADSSPEIPWFTGVIFVRGAAGAQVAARSN